MKRQCRTLKNPDTAEAKDWLNEIIVAAGLGGIKNDSLTHIGFVGGSVNVRTEYSIRGCAQSADFELPVCIIDAEDPIKAATEWGLRNRAIKAQSEAHEARKILADKEEALSKADEALARFYAAP